MATKKPRIDVSLERKPLQDTPFAGLLAAADTPANSAMSTTTNSGNTSNEATQNYSIARTRKGGYPIHLEKRGGGKCVTIVGGLSGDLAELLKTLRKLCGSGGALREGALELQGDHREKLETFFKGKAKQE